MDYGFYNNYVFKVRDTDLISSLALNWEYLKALMVRLDEGQLNYRYAEGKWSIKEIFTHLIDGERNFCYRIMRISRGDQAHLPMYDVHSFVANSHSEKRDIKNMITEMELLRKATIKMFEGMDEEVLEMTGPARDVTISVRALGYALVGHCWHHIDIINEKYLQPTSA